MSYCRVSIIPTEVIITQSLFHLYEDERSQVSTAFQYWPHTLNKHSPRPVFLAGVVGNHINYFPLETNSCCMPHSHRPPERPLLLLCIEPLLGIYALTCTVL